MKKIIISFSLFVFIIILFSVPFFANAPAPADSVIINIKNQDNNICYVDILIRINDISVDYTEFNSENGEKYNISENSEISEYNKDNYHSFTFHYKESISDMELQKNDDSYKVEFAKSDGYSMQLRDLNKTYNKIKLAFLDEKGNILKISSVFDISPPFFFLTSDVNYDFSTDTFTARFYKSQFDAMIFSLFMGISRIAFSVIIELLIAVLFSLNRKGIILLTNLITQLGMTTVMSFIFLPYIQMLIIMETNIYILEFAIYKLEYNEVKTKTILLYTITANTASLFLGLLFNFLGIFKG
jgi:hypothetical protein